MSDATVFADLDEYPEGEDPLADVRGLVEAVLNVAYACPEHAIRLRPEDMIAVPRPALWVLQDALALLNSLCAERGLPVVEYEFSRCGYTGGGAKGSEH